MEQVDWAELVRNADLESKRVRESGKKLSKGSLMVIDFSGRVSNKDIETFSKAVEEGK